MMKKSDKFAISSITVCYAEITNLPQDYLHSSGTQISFDHVKDNEVKVSFDFQNSSFSEQEAFRFAMCETYKITYSIALQHKLHAECNPCYATSWDDSTFSVRSASTSGKTTIAFPSDIRPMLSGNFEKYEAALMFFNQALYYNEKAGKEKEVAFWIYFSYEALQNALYGMRKEHKLRNESTKNGSFDNKKFNDFKKSIGQYYRHYKSSYKGKILTIKECLEIYRAILAYFVNK